jgi:tetratricopeptide (TPR) repeat protein
MEKRNKTDETILIREKSVGEDLRELKAELDSDSPLWKKILHASYVGGKIIGRELKDFKEYEKRLFEIESELKKQIRNREASEKVIRETVKEILYRCREGGFLLTDYLDTGCGNCIAEVSLFLSLAERIAPELFKKCYVGDIAGYVVGDPPRVIPGHVMIIIKDEANGKLEYVDFGLTAPAEHYQRYYGKIPEMREKQTIISHILSNVGATLLDLGRYEEAIQWFDEAIKRDPNNIGARYGMGYAFLYSNKYKEAIECFDRVIKKDSRNAGAWYGMGLAYLGLDKRKEAVECFDKAMRQVKKHNKENALV